MANRQFNIKTFYFLGLLLSLFLYGCQDKVDKKVPNAKLSDYQDNTLNDQEIREGWKLLFDGKTFNGWRNLGMDHVQTALWKIENGEIHKVNSGDVPSLPDGQPVEGGDLMTVETFDNYELYFEWKILKAGNTGLKYNVSEELSQKYSDHSALGFEYQLLDDKDTLYAGKLKPSQYTGSLYDLIPAKNTKLKPVGKYNASRIIIDGNHVQHWLNGEKVVEYNFGSKQLDSLYKISKYKEYPHFLEKRSGHIILQNHKDDAWFRNIKIRVINRSY
ncbi:DUF1080 domain-containing protein [Flavobacteriaceae bacterium F89]|uniref:DUF1080 domain-containing protein n=1 Tax=Cerina litoralis TaxID=2874477 RepID=A0AAE3JTU5_9FLAO|nr:DUF1080 domain-containing protein [Cerina litoralis]MCG2461807.1 DUF1080 domain-containing protein [Cerina litoralis]